MQTIRIEPKSGTDIVSWSELFRYRDLFYFLVWRDLKVRYKQTILGIAWAIIPPIFSTVIFTFIFGKFMQIPTDGAPYSIFVFSGLLLWQLFSHALTEASNSLILNQQLITKVYFPRILIPIASISSAIVDFFCAFLIFVVLLFFFQTKISVQILLLPFFVLLSLMSAIGIGLWLSALNAKYRDVRYALPVLIQIWFFSTPITYTTTHFPELGKWVISLNPITGIIEGFRWSVFANGIFPAQSIVISITISLGLLISGLFYFSKVERILSDVI